MANAVELSISGSKINNKTLQLLPGWNLIPVLSECPADVAVLFEGQNLVIIKEVAGWNMYWPEFGIHTLNALEPGKAYFVLMNAGDSITFPDCQPGTSKSVKPPAYQPEKEKQYQELLSVLGITRTAITHTIAFPGNTMSELVPGDLILVTDHMGNCFGIAAISEGNTAMTLYGNDPFTTIKDGFDEQEVLYFKLLRGNDEYLLDVELDDRFPQPEKEFVQNGLSALKSVKVLNNSVINAPEDYPVKIIPNPARDAFKLILPHEDFKVCTLKMYSADGQMVNQCAVLKKESMVNISALKPGVYMLKIEMDDAVVIKRLIKN